MYTCILIRWNFFCSHARCSWILISLVLFSQNIVSALEKVVKWQFSAEHEWMTQEQETHLRETALKALTSTLHSMVLWARGTNQEKGKPEREEPADSSNHHNTPLALDDCAVDNTTKERRASVDSTVSSTDSSSQPFTAVSTEVESPGKDKREARLPSFFMNFQVQREMRQKKETGILKFNMKPKKGIEYLVKAGVIENDPESLATFFHENSGTLDKVRLGEFMGEGDEFNKKTLYAFVEALNFSGTLKHLAKLDFTLERIV